ncbi:MAG: phosphate signaling complex protein PhoU [Parafilimonas sp.]|nr:phosphate signaling complex protein PhoU [Parafilimonas sp.]
MTQLETDLQQLKSEVINMWTMVRGQLLKALSSLLNFDKDLAREVVVMEKRINATELKIDRDCENIFALYSPVAIDLRFLLAVLKINTNLERTGDIAEGIAKHVISVDKPFKEDLLEATKVIEMYRESIAMLEDTLTAFQKEDTILARSVFEKDEFLDEINSQTNELIEAYLKNNPAEIDQALYASAIIRKLERVGDQSKNIAEEIIFYIEAKVLKHLNKVEK